MRAIRLSLLEADVSLPVVKQLTTAIAARAKGAEVMDSLTPDQQVVKIVSEELTTLMGEANVALPLASKPPTIVLMAGLQGSGKTTCCAKLARYFRAQGRAPMLVACDVHRPAAAEQLAVLGGQIDVPVHREEGTRRRRDRPQRHRGGAPHRPRPGDRGHRRPPDDRRRDDGRARPHQGRRAAHERRAGGGRHDRPDRGRRGQGLRRGGRTSTASRSPSSTATPAAARRCRCGR